MFGKVQQSRLVGLQVNAGEPGYGLPCQMVAGQGFGHCRRNFRPGCAPVAAQADTERPGVEQGGQAQRFAVATEQQVGALFPELLFYTIFINFSFSKISFFVEIGRASCRERV